MKIRRIIHYPVLLIVISYYIQTSMVVLYYTHHTFHIMLKRNLRNINQQIKLVLFKLQIILGYMNTKHKNICIYVLEKANIYFCKYILKPPKTSKEY